MGTVQTKKYCDTRHNIKIVLVHKYKMHLGFKVSTFMYLLLLSNLIFTTRSD